MWSFCNVLWNKQRVLLNSSIAFEFIEFSILERFTPISQDYKEKAFCCLFLNVQDTFSLSKTKQKISKSSPLRNPLKNQPKELNQKERKTQLLSQANDQQKEKQFVKKLLILDLDETLLCAKKHKTKGYHFQLQLQHNGKTMTLYLTKRPYLNQFLKNMSQIYDICVFTAGAETYCKKVIQGIDRYREFIKWDYSRDDCIKMSENLYCKDIFKILEDKYSYKDRILVDNSKQSFILCPQNGILIKDFYGDPDDKELLKLQKQLHKLAQIEDVQLVLEPLKD